MFRRECDVTIYSEAGKFASFPAVAHLGGGRLMAVFRSAPNWQGFPGIAPEWYTHLDCNSRIVHAISEDGGLTWGAPRPFPQLPFGAAQDGGIFFDGKTLLVNSFAWGFPPPNVVEQLQAHGQDDYLLARASGAALPLGQFVLRSIDLGQTWEGPFQPDPLVSGGEVAPGIPRRPHNRTNIVQLPDGRLLLAGQDFHYRPRHHSRCVLYESRDGGESWQYLAVVAEDGGVAVFEEPALIRTASGRLVMLLRTHCALDGAEFKRARLFRTVSEDGGRTWSVPENTGVHGEPAHLCPMENGKILVSIGHREAPFGVRLRICDAELSNLAAAEEIVLRDDGGRPNTGYPWATPLGGNRYFIAYYLDPPGGRSGVFGTIATVE